MVVMHIKAVLLMTLQYDGNGGAIHEYKSLIIVYTVRPDASKNAQKTFKYTATIIIMTTTTMMVTITIIIIIIIIIIIYIPYLNKL